MSSSQRNHIDLATLIVVLTLMVLGLLVVYSASSTFALLKLGSSAKLMQLHVIKILVGFAVIIVFMNIDYHRYQRLTKPVLLIAIGFLVLTLALNATGRGVARWLRFWDFGFQPSEFARFALLFHLCTLICVKGDRVRSFAAGFRPMIIWIGSVTILVLLQPNFSTGMMIVLISVMMMMIGRVRVRHVVLSLLAVAPLLVLYVLKAPYRVKRVLAFIGFSDETGHKINTQLWQGLLGFANGGVLGVGLGESKQRDLFLPESYSDFVFSIVGEEYGFVGTLFLLGLFLILLWRGMRIARYARDLFGCLLAIGITLSITVYALVHAGVTLGILPTTGLPLPFVSYGGSSMVFSSAAIGVLLNISSQTDLHPRVPKPSAEKVTPAPAVGQVY